MTDRAKGNEEEYRRDTGDDDQPNIDCAVQPLPRPAMGTVGEVLLVVTAHFRSNAGDVVSPAGKNVAYYLINTV